jgi:RHS repeat-associated protein
MYDSYGAMENVMNTPVDKTKEKFTGKEFDEEGALYGKLDIDISLLSDQVSATQPSAMGIYYTDAPNDPTKADIIMAEKDPGTNYCRFKKTLYCTSDKTISWIHLLYYNVNNEKKDCQVRDINEYVGPGTNMTITKTIASLNPPPPQTTTKDYLVYTKQNTTIAGGIGKYYFGRRYYDPEIGAFCSADSKGQFFNPYGYSSNPILFVDPDGNFFGLFASSALFDLAFTTVAGAAIGAGIGALADNNFKNDWGYWVAGGAAVGAGAWLGSQHVRNLVGWGKWMSDNALIQSSPGMQALYKGYGVSITPKPGTEEAALYNKVDLVQQAKNTNFRIDHWARTSTGSATMGEARMVRGAVNDLMSNQPWHNLFGAEQAMHEVVHTLPQGSGTESLALQLQQQLHPALGRSLGQFESNPAFYTRDNPFTTNWAAWEGESINTNFNINVARF